MFNCNTHDRRIVLFGRGNLTTNRRDRWLGFSVDVANPHIVCVRVCVCGVYVDVENSHECVRGCRNSHECVCVVCAWM